MSMSIKGRDSTVPFRKKKKGKVKEATLTLKLTGVVKEARHRASHIKGRRRFSPCDQTLSRDNLWNLCSPWWGGTAVGGLSLVQLRLFVLRPTRKQRRWSLKGEDQSQSLEQWDLFPLAETHLRRVLQPSK